MTSQLEPGLQLLPRPSVHADFTPATALAAPHEQRAARLVEITFGEFQRLVDPEPSSPEDHDERPDPLAVRPVACGTHNRDDLFDLGWVGWVPVTLVAGRLPDVESRQRRGRPAAKGAIEHELGHDRLLADREYHALSAGCEDA